MGLRCIDLVPLALRNHMPLIKFVRRTPTNRELLEAFSSLRRLVRTPLDKSTVASLIHSHLSNPSCHCRPLEKFAVRRRWNILLAQPCSRWLVGTQIIFSLFLKISSSSLILPPLNIFHPSHCLGFCNVLSCSALISSRFMYQASRGKFHYVSYVSLKWIFVLMIGVGKVFFCYSIQLSFLLMSDFVCIINVAFMLPLIGNLEIGKI